MSGYDKSQNKNTAIALQEFLRLQMEECARLRAELAALREQEPVAWAYRFSIPERHDDVHDDDAYSEVVYRTRRELSPDDPFGRRGRDFDDAADTTETALYAAPVPSQDDARDALMREMADELRVYIAMDYPPDTHDYPSRKRKFDAAMDVVNRAEAILSAKGGAK